MVNLYKAWHLDADESGYYVGRVLDGKMINPVKYDNAVDAVKHVIEVELRQGVAKPELLSCYEFIAIYSDVAEDVVDAVKHAPAAIHEADVKPRQSVKKYRPQGMETRLKA